VVDAWKDLVMVYIRQLPASTSPTTITTTISTTSTTSIGCDTDESKNKVEMEEREEGMFGYIFLCIMYNYI
jgi:hypothetical protein